MRSRVIRGMLVLAAAGVAGALLLQAVPYGRAHANPAVVAEPAWDSAQTRGLFMRACGDCHSHETVWPWYSNVAPVSWLVQRDVDEGREKFNVSAWSQSHNHGDEAAETFQNGEMPMPIYLLTHPEAKLAGVDRQTLLAGLVATFGGEGDD